MAELEKNLKDESDFPFQLARGLAGGVDECPGDSVATFRKALGTYKSGKSRELIEAKFGAATVRNIFELIRREHGENYVDKTRGELADRCIMTSRSSWPSQHCRALGSRRLINERKPAAPGPPASEVHLAAPIPVVLATDPAHLSASSPTLRCSIVERLLPVADGRGNQSRKSPKH